MEMGRLLQLLLLLLALHCTHENAQRHGVEDQNGSKFVSLEISSSVPVTWRGGIQHLHYWVLVLLTAEHTAIDAGWNCLHQCTGYTSRRSGRVARIMRIIKGGLTVIGNSIQRVHWQESLGALQLAIN